MPWPNFFFFFFWKSPDFGQKKALNFGFRPKNHSEFWRRPFFFFFFFFFFFGDHLILGGKKLWISELSETFRLKFRTNRLKLIQDQWKFESRSFAHFSLFQNSPPLFKILRTLLGKEYRFCKSLLKLYLFFILLLLHKGSLRYGPPGATNFSKKANDKNEIHLKIKMTRIKAFNF